MLKKTNDWNNASASTFLDPADRARRACELAAAELRFGRPVVLKSPGSGEALAAMALDTITRRDFRRFSEVTHGRHELFLTPERSAMLGLETPSGAMVPLAARDFAFACDLGYRPDTTAPENWFGAPESLAHLVQLTRLSLLLPALLVARIDADDRGFEGCVHISPAEIETAGAVEDSFEIVARTPVPLKDVTQAEFVVFRGGLSQRDQVAIVVGEPDRSRPVSVRIHSSCLTGDLFGSLKCDCGDQLREGLRLIEARGGGVLLYLDQEGRGTGIGAKMRAYGYQARGLDTIDADANLGFGPDGRRYGAAIAMLRGLGIAKVELLTNNPAKAAALEAGGIAVTRRTPVLGEVTAHNQAYLTTKATRAGHLLDIEAIAAALGPR